MARWARWVIGPFLAAPLGAWALGLGEIELKSALNQPLNAEIELVSATSEELESLRVELAPRDTFERYGIDRPAFLSDLLFNITRDASGGAIVRVASVQSITEPFVTILVEANWARGRLLREYTVLLDPPVLMPAPAIQTPVATPATGPARGDQAGRIARPAPATTRASTAQPTAPAAGAAAPIARPAARPAEGTYGPVQRDETLWAIAARFRPSDQVSMNQMMLAIFQANPQAFNGNINELRRGAILRLPDLAVATGVSATAARQEVARQNSAWRDSAPAAAAVPDTAARLRLVSPDDGSTGTRPAAGGADSARVGELEGEVQRLQGELAETQRLIDIRDSQLQELQQRLAAAEAAAAGADQTLPAAEPAPAATSPGVDLEAGDLAGEELFADEGEAADVPAVDAPVTQALPEEAIDAEPASAAPPASTRVVTSAPSEPSLVDTILGWLVKPLLWILLGVLALAGTAVWYLRHRQESVEDITGRWEALEAEAEHEFATDATDQLRAPVPAADEGFVVVEQPTEAEQTQPGLKALPESLGVANLDEETLSGETAINLDQADPVAEADFHMAYGLYDQAADLLSKALSADPDRRDLKMKLLEVFFVWGNHEQFLGTAQSLHADMDDGGDPDWDKIVIMGRQICPDAELFAQAPAPSADVLDLDLEVGAGSELDFSLDEEAASEVDFDLDFGVVDETAVAGGEAEMIAAIEAEPAAETAPPDAADTFSGAGPDAEDLDIGARTAAGLEAALLGDLAPPAAESDAEALLDRPEFADAGLPDEAQFLEGEAPTAEMPTIETPAAAESTADLRNPGGGRVHRGSAHHRNTGGGRVHGGYSRYRDARGG
jgi:pilus assembly protein FimV